MARISKSLRFRPRSLDLFRPTAFFVFSRPFPEADQRKRNTGGCGSQTRCKSPLCQNGKAEKRRRAQTSDEAAEAEQLRSQQTALKAAEKTLDPRTGGRGTQFWG